MDTQAIASEFNRLHAKIDAIYADSAWRDVGWQPIRSYLPMMKRDHMQNVSNPLPPLIYPPRRLVIDYCCDCYGDDVGYRVSHWDSPWSFKFDTWQDAMDYMFLICAEDERIGWVWQPETEKMLRLTVYPQGNITLQDE